MSTTTCSYSCTTVGPRLPHAAVGNRAECTRVRRLGILGAHVRPRDGPVDERDAAPAAAGMLLARSVAAAAAAPAGLAVDLSGRVARVTGATGQLGRTMVRQLARAGADVAVHYRGNRAKAEALCQDVEALGRRA